MRDLSTWQQTVTPSRGAPFSHPHWKICDPPERVTRNQLLWGSYALGKVHTNLAWLAPRLDLQMHVCFGVGSSHMLRLLAIERHDDQLYHG